MSLTQKQKKYYKSKRQEWVTRGLCQTCQQPKEQSDKSYCNTCLQKYSQNWKIKQEYARKHGKCTACHRNEVVKERAQCNACLQKDMQKRTKLKKNRVCTRCRKNPSNFPQSRCNTCLNYEQDKKRKLKDEVFGAYGGYQCSCLGCSVLEPLFLVIDHVNNDGAIHRRQIKTGSGTNFYSWLKRNGFPSGFQVLCNNCNQGKRMNNGVCPLYGKPHARDQNGS